ncbi:MAG: zinc-dependent alcohol dehydrogenase [Limnochordia bacterium]|jgi:L-iditol 2-dehydrogenase
MKALVKYAEGVGNMEIREVPEPSPGPGQVKVEVKAAGICGSDLHIYHYDIGIPMRLPVVTGHEFSGQVVEVGEGVTEYKPGDRVTSETSFSTCGTCIHCQTGSYNLCLKREGIGYIHGGAFAKYVVVPKERVHPLPDSVDYIGGALTEPLACVVHGALELTGVQAGDVVLVTGPGAIGLLTAQVAKAEGGYVVVAGTSVDEHRLEVAKSLGVDMTVNVEKENVVEILKDMTRGRGADVVLECSGAAPGARLCLEAVRRGGRYGQIGLFGKPIEIDFEQICYKEVRVSGSFSQKWSAWDRSLRLLDRGLVKTNPLVSDILPLTEWEEAFRKFEAKEGLKIVLQPVD